MDDQTLIERLRREAAQLDAGARDPSPLVRRAVTQGRRRRTRRRLGAAVGGVVVAAVVSVAVATSIPSTVPSIAVPDPAGTPVSGAPTVAATSASPSPSSSPTASVSTGVVKAKPDDVRQVATSLLPGSLQVTSSSSSRDEGSNGFPWEYTAALTVQDTAGTSYLIASVGNGSYEDGCLNLKGCTKHTQPDGGLVWVTSSPAGDKAGQDRTFTYDRADGAHLFLMQRNYASGNGPVTRTGLPLTDAKAIALITDPEWDRLFRG